MNRQGLLRENPTLAALRVPKVDCPRDSIGSRANDHHGRTLPGARELRLPWRERGLLAILDLYEVSHARVAYNQVWEISTRVAHNQVWEVSARVSGVVN